jgi:hypothetical protein
VVALGTSAGSQLTGDKLSHGSRDPYGEAGAADMANGGDAV